MPSPVFISAMRAVVQDHAADQLHVEMPLAEGADCRLPHHREGLRHDVVEASAGGEFFAELRGFGPQRLVR